MNKNSFVAIMAGGIGSRFWPVSRMNHPKQFLDLINQGKTLIQSTFERFAQYIAIENIYIVTSVQYRQLVAEQLPDLPEQNILCEPSRKNTAACIAYISYKLNELNPESNLICAPADHLILDDTAFKKVSLDALEFTEKNNALVTLGVKPTSPNTGYGYIQYEHHAITSNIYKVKTFTEKPDLELAKSFINSGDFLWNAGIFVWRTSSIISAFEKCLPEMHEVFAGARQGLVGHNEQETVNQIYPLCTNISIDYGVLEKADNVYVIPSSFGWSDLGTWGSAYQNLEKDYYENAVAADNTVLFDSYRNVIHANHQKLILLQGLEDYIVVDTDDVLLVCKKDKEQQIKDYVAEIKRNKGDRFL